MLAIQFNIKAGKKKVCAVYNRPGKKTNVPLCARIVLSTASGHLSSKERWRSVSVLVTAQRSDHMNDHSTAQLDDTEVLSWYFVFVLE